MGTILRLFFGRFWWVWLLLVVVGLLWLRFDTRRRKRLGLPSRQRNHYLMLAFYLLVVMVIALAGFVFIGSLKHQGPYVEPVLEDGTLRRGHEAQ